MKAKIFLGEYAYIYRGNIDLREMNEYVKTLTKRAYILKWRNLDDDMISVRKKQDLEYFYNTWIKNSINNRNRTFRLYIYELFCQPQPQQASQNSQTQIQSKLVSPNQKLISQRQQQLAFTFGPNHDFQNALQKSQESQKESHRVSQGNTLESILEQNESIRNLSDKNLDQQFQRFSFYKQKTITLQVDNTSEIPQFYQNQEEQIPQQQFGDQSSYFSNPQLQVQEVADQEMKVSIAKRTINRGCYEDVPLIDEQALDQNEFEVEQEVIESDDEPVDRFRNIYCDYCSEQIISGNDASDKVYFCSFCEDVHICARCFESTQDVHHHQLQQQAIS